MRIDESRRALLSAAVLATVASAGSASAEEPKPMLMFVQIADDLKVDPAAQTLRLVKVGQQTLYFADRPERIAGHIKMADFLTEWTSKAGPDNFGNDPPNATLSVFEPGKNVAICRMVATGIETRRESQATWWLSPS